MKVIILLSVALMLTGCATMNCSSQNSVGDNNKPSIKTDAEATQDIKPNTTIPASIIP